MPRIGSTKKSGEKTARPFPDALRQAQADPSHVLAPLAADVRAMAEQSARETLEYIKTVQTSTRDRTGRIKRAKFKAGVLALRWEGFTPKETAEILGASIYQVEWALSQIRADASIDDQLTRLDSVAVPLAIDNVIRGVMDGDKEYSLKVLDGRGVFRAFKSLDAQVKKTVLKLEVRATMPAHIPQDAIPMPKFGSVVGQPGEPTTEAELVPAKPKQLAGVGVPDSR